MHAGLARSLTTVQVGALVSTHMEALAAIPDSLHMDPSLHVAGLAHPWAPLSAYTHSFGATFLPLSGCLALRWKTESFSQ